MPLSGGAHNSTAPATRSPPVVRAHSPERRNQAPADAEGRVTAGLPAHMRAFVRQSSASSGLQASPANAPQAHPSPPQPNHGRQLRAHVPGAVARLSLAQVEAARRTSTATQLGASGGGARLQSRSLVSLGVETEQSIAVLAGVCNASSLAGSIHDIVHASESRKASNSLSAGRLTAGASSSSLGTVPGRPGSVDVGANSVPLRRLEHDRRLFAEVERAIQEVSDSAATTPYTSVEASAAALQARFPKTEQPNLPGSVDVDDVLASQRGEQLPNVVVVEVATPTSFTNYNAQLEGSQQSGYTLHGSHRESSHRSPSLSSSRRSPRTQPRMLWSRATLRARDPLAGSEPRAGSQHSLRFWQDMLRWSRSRSNTGTFVSVSTGEGSTRRPPRPLEKHLRFVNTALTFLGMRHDGSRVGLWVSRVLCLFGFLMTLSRLVRTLSFYGMRRNGLAEDLVDTISWTLGHAAMVVMYVQIYYVFRRRNYVHHMLSVLDPLVADIPERRALVNTLRVLSATVFLLFIIYFPLASLPYIANEISYGTPKQNDIDEAMAGHLGVGYALFFVVTNLYLCAGFCVFLIIPFVIVHLLVWRIDMFLIGFVEYRFSQDGRWAVPALPPDGANSAGDSMEKPEDGGTYIDGAAAAQGALGLESGGANAIVDKVLELRDRKRRAQQLQENLVRDKRVKMDSRRTHNGRSGSEEFMYYRDPSLNGSVTSTSSDGGLSVRSGSVGRKPSAALSVAGALSPVAERKAEAPQEMPMEDAVGEVEVIVTDACEPTLADSAADVPCDSHAGTCPGGQAIAHVTLADPEPTVGSPGDATGPACDGGRAPAKSIAGPGAEGVDDVLPNATVACQSGAGTDGHDDVPTEMVDDAAPPPQDIEIPTTYDQRLTNSAPTFTMANFYGTSAQGNRSAFSTGTYGATLRVGGAPSDGLFDSSNGYSKPGWPPVPWSQETGMNGAAASLAASSLVSAPLARVTSEADLDTSGLSLVSAMAASEQSLRSQTQQSLGKGDAVVEENIANADVLDNAAWDALMIVALRQYSRVMTVLLCMCFIPWIVCLVALKIYTGGLRPPLADLAVPTVFITCHFLTTALMYMFRQRRRLLRRAVLGEDVKKDVERTALVVVPYREIAGPLLRLVLKSFGAAVVGFGVLMLNLFLVNPNCFGATESMWSEMSGNCTDAEILRRAIVWPLSQAPVTSAPAWWLYAMGGWVLVRPIARFAVAVEVIFIPLSAVVLHSSYRNTMWWSTVAYAPYLLISFFGGFVLYHRFHRRWKIAAAATGMFVFVLALLAMYDAVVVHLALTSASAPWRIFIVIIVHKAMSIALLYVVSWLTLTVSRLSGNALSNFHVVALCVDAGLQTIGRLFFSSLDSMADLGILVSINIAVEVGARLSRPLTTFMSALVTRRSWRRAWQALREHTVEEFPDLMLIYTRMATGYFGILLAALATIAGRLYYNNPLPGLSMHTTLVQAVVAFCMQTIGQYLGDLFSSKFETDYLQRPTVVLHKEVRRAPARHFWLVPLISVLYATARVSAILRVGKT